MTFKEFGLKWLNRILIGVFILGALIGGGYFGAVWFYRSLFSDNPRFALTRDLIEIKTPGAQSQMLSDLSRLIYSDFNKDSECRQIWEAVVLNAHINKGVRPDEIQKLVRTTKSVNVFDLDLGTLRQSICKISTIRYAELELVLPDRLIIKVHTRYPIAMLEREDGAYVCDDEGIIMERNREEIQRGQLPVILGLNRKNFRSGISLGSQVRPALHLINHISQNPDLGLRISKVSVRDLDRQGVMSVICYFKLNDTAEERKYLVELPTDARLIAKLEDLLILLRNLHRAPSRINYIRLIYDEPAVQSTTDISKW